MSLRTALLASSNITTDPALRHEAMATRAGILAAIGAGALSQERDIAIFAHKYDPARALAWIREAQRETSADEIFAPGITSPVGVARTVRMWRAFGAYWKCINVRPYAWEPFRQVCEDAWGWRAIRDTRPNAYWQGKPQRGAEGVDDETPGIWRDGRQRDASGELLPRTDWRTAIVDYFHTRRSRDVDDLLDDPTKLTFGQPFPDQDEAIGGPSPLAWLNGGIGHPTGELHPIWLNDDGTVEALDDRLWTFAGSPSLYGATKHVLIPTFWYWELLARRTVPALGGRTILEYLAETPPVEVIRSARRDVLARNSRMAGVHRMNLNDLVGASTRDEATRAAEAVRDADQVDTFIIAGGAVVTTILGAASGPVGLALGGGLTVATRLMVRLFENTSLEGPIHIDVFGRRMPVFEVFEIAASEGDLLGRIREAGVPPGYREVETSSGSTDVSIFAGPETAPPALEVVQLDVLAPTEATVRVIGLVEGDVVRLFNADAQSIEPSATDPGRASFLHLAPGAYEVRVTPLAGPVRARALEVRAGFGNVIVDLSPPPPPAEPFVPPVEPPAKSSRVGRWLAIGALGGVATWAGYQVVTRSRG